MVVDTPLESHPAAFSYSCWQIGNVSNGMPAFPLKRRYYAWSNTASRWKRCHPLFEHVATLALISGKNRPTKRGCRGRRISSPGVGGSYLRPLASDGGKLSCRVTNRVIERGGNGLTKTGIGPASGRRAQLGLRNNGCANSVPPLFPLGRASAHSSCCSASAAPTSSSAAWGKGLQELFHHSVQLAVDLCGRQ